MLAMLRCVLRAPILNRTGPHADLPREARPILNRTVRYAAAIGASRGLGP